MSRWLAVLLAFGAGAAQAATADVPFHFKPDTGNLASLQRGARHYMNYCVGCHSLQYLRYNRMARDLGIPEELLREHLMFTSDKPGDHILAAMPAASEKWFGRVPPDLSLTARERGPDWVYSYLLSFYLDPKKPTGVNNLVLRDASMPHVLGGLQGWQVAHFVEAEKQDLWGNTELDVLGNPIKETHFERFELVQPGSLSPAEYRTFVGDLTNFLVYAAEPGRNDRVSLGWKVLAFIVLFWFMSWLLKREYWKDV